MMTRCQCVRFGTCPLADAGATIEINPGEPHDCPLNDPGCREKLVKLQDPDSRSRVVRIALISLAAVAIGTGVKIGTEWGHHDHHRPEPPKPTVGQLLNDVWPWLESPTQ